MVRPAVARPSAPSLAPAASPVAVSHATVARRADPGAAVVVRVHSDAADAAPAVVTLGARHL